MKLRSAAPVAVLVSAGLVLATVLGSHAVRGDELSRLVELLDVDPGEVFADVGAGDGKWSVALAGEVGDGGIVYATEVDPDDLKKIEERVAREKLVNVGVVRGTQEETGLPDACSSSSISTPGGAGAGPRGSRRRATATASTRSFSFPRWKRPVSLS